MAGLPRAIHLIAQAPHLDAERLIGTIGATLLGELGAAGNIRVFQQVEGLFKTTGTQIYGFHQLVAAGFFQPFRHFVQTKLIGLGGMPCQVQATRPLITRTNAILPAIAGNEIAARIANRGSAEFLDQFDDVLAETVFIGFGVARLIDAVVYAATQMLHERPEQSVVDRSYFKVIIDDESRFLQLPRFIVVRMLGHVLSFNRCLQYRKTTLC